MKKSVCTVLLAAGASSRMGVDAQGNAVNKLLMRFCGMTPIELCVKAFEPFSDEMVIAVNSVTRAAAEEATRSYKRIPIQIVDGGQQRQNSVLNCLNATTADIVVIHDCARCLVTPSVIQDSIRMAEVCGCGAASVSVRDTIRSKATGETINRDGMLAAQTPQSFERKRLIEAYNNADERQTFTDDASVWLMAGNTIGYSQGSIANQKLTEADDAALFEQVLSKRLTDVRVGYGEDTHRLVSDRKLILGGVEVPFSMGLLGHSDADALIHALMDALLGAAALGDIGMHFPDCDPQYKDASSMTLLRHVIGLLYERDFTVKNVDCTIIAQKPKLSPYRDMMQKNIAEALGIGNEYVSIKFTTPEGMNAEGRMECITARAIVCTAKC